MAEQSMVMREYRKGNWTLQETMILIEAKKMDDERRKVSKKHGVLSPTTSGGVVMKPVTELRWKWVEEYCWRKGCFRSQNQCNDKWDNLMRDYKKVRDYIKKLGDGDHDEEGGVTSNKSYWQMDKVERKDKGLPTNMLPQIYQALFDVVERSSTTPTTPTTTTTTTTVVTTVSGACYSPVGQFLLPPPQVMQLPVSLSMPPPSPPAPLLLQSPSRSTLPAPLPLYSPQQHQQQQQPLLQPTLESETAGGQSQPESPAKRRRKHEIRAAGEGGTSAATQMAAAAPSTSSTTSFQEVNTALCKIAEAMQANNEREEMRHREIMNLQQTILRIEESNLEITRQGFNGLTDAINNLASSIRTWVNSSHNNHGSS